MNMLLLILHCVQDKQIKYLLQELYEAISE